MAAKTAANQNMTSTMLLVMSDYRNTLKSRLILSVVTKRDLWSLIQDGFKNGHQSENDFDHVNRDVKLPLTEVPIDSLSYNEM